LLDELVKLTFTIFPLILKNLAKKKRRHLLFLKIHKFQKNPSLDTSPVKNENKFITNCKQLFFLKTQIKLLKSYLVYKTGGQNKVALKKRAMSSFC